MPQRKHITLALAVCIIIAGAVLSFAPSRAQAITTQEKSALIFQLVQKVLELQQRIVALGGTPIAIPPALVALAQGSSAPAATPSCTLSRTLAFGAKGEDVTCLQRFLITQNLLTSDSATGFFGALTRSAVKQFQRSHNLEPVGHVGRLTRAIINEVRSTTLATKSATATSNTPTTANTPAPSVAGGGGSGTPSPAGGGGGGGGSSAPAGGGGVSQTSSTALACTLSISPASMKAGDIFTLSWTSTGTPVAISGYLEQTAPDNSKATFFRPIPYSSYLLPNGGRSGKAGTAGAYTYTFVVSNATATTSCSTGLSVTGTAPLPMIPTILDRVGKGLFSTAGQNDTQHDVAFGGPVNINLNASTTIFYGYYIPYSREPYVRAHVYHVVEAHDAIWYKQHHPDWLLYTGDKTTPVGDFCYLANGSIRPGPPWPCDPPAYFLPSIDFTNPDVRTYIWSRAIAPMIMEGHQAITFDNLSPLIPIATWVQGPSGWKQLFTATDPAFSGAVADWLRWMKDRLHQNGMRVIVNLAYGHGYDTDFMKIAREADMVNVESVFLDASTCTYKNKANYSGDRWVARFNLLRRTAIEARSPKNELGLLLMNACSGGSERDITTETIHWVLANYLLIRGPQTFVEFEFYPNAYGLSAPGSVLTDFTLRPEFNAPLGAPVGAPAQVPGPAWVRMYQNGMAIVNPDANVATSVSLGSDPYRNISTNRILAGDISIPPISGVVLVKVAPTDLDARRKADLSLLQQGLEKYYATYGTYKIAGAGSNGNGNGWVAFEGTAGGVTYPKSITRALFEEGLLATSTIKDPDPAQGRFGGYMLYLCQTATSSNYSLSATLNSPSAEEISYAQMGCNATGANGTYPRYGKNYMLTGVNGAPNIAPY